MSQNNPYADTDPTSNPLPDQPPASDPAAAPAAAPAKPSPAAQSALDEISRLDDVISSLQTQIGDPKLQGISGQPQRDKIQQQLSQATQELAIAHRKYTDILAQEGRTAAGTTRTGSVQTITRPEGTYTKDGPPDASGKPTWRIATDAQGNPLPGSGSKTTTPPTAGNQWQPITGPDGQVLAMQDPATGDRVSVPAGAKPERPTIVNGQNGAVYSWDGTSLTSLVQGKPDKPQIVQGQNGAVYTWDGQQLNTVLQPTKTQPKEGDTRPNVDKNGYRIQERYQGGDWVTDPSVAPTPFSPEAASKPTEGATRRNVQGGYAVTERYSGGQWVIDPDVAPVPYTPQAPTTVQTGTADQFIVQQDPQTGKTTQIPNPNYQPAAADIAGRVQQLQQQARTQRDKLQQDVLNGTKTSEQAAQEFDQYWSSSVDPYVKQAQAAQAQTTFENQVKAQQEQRNQEEQDRSIYSTAQTAGQNAAKNVMDTMPYRVGPGFGNAVNQIAQSYATHQMPGNLDLGSAVTFDMPDINSIAHQATAEALAHISPTAAAAAGRPMPQVPQGMDVSGMLNRSQYQFGPGAAPTTTIAPDGTVTIQHTSGQSTPAAAPAAPAPPPAAVPGTVYPQGAMGGVDAQTGATYTAPPFQGTGQPFTGEVDPSQLD